MRVSILESNFKPAVKLVANAIGSRPSLPVLSNILLSTDDYRLKLQATNLELSVTTWIGAKVESEGAITLPLSALDTTLVPYKRGKLPDFDTDQRLDLELDERTCTATLKADSKTQTIKGISASEFPATSLYTFRQVVTIPGAPFKQAVKFVTEAAAITDQRPVLTGIHLQLIAANNANKPYSERTTDKLILTGADGFRIHRAVITLDTCVAQDYTAIIPARTLQVLAKIAADDTDIVLLDGKPGRDQVGFQFTSQHAKKELGFRTEILSQLIPGDYPDADSVIPTNFLWSATFSAPELQRSLKRARVFSDTVYIDMVSSEWEDGIKSGLMSITGKSDELGDVTTDLEVAYNGPDRAMAYKSEYLRDTLAAMSKLSSSLILKFNRASQATAVSIQDGALVLMSVIQPMIIPDTSYSDAVGHSYPRIDQYPGETDKQQLDRTLAKNEYTEWEKANLPLAVRARKVQQDKPAWGPDDGAEWYEEEYRRWWRDTFTVQPTIPVLPAAPAKDYGSPRPRRRTVHSPKNSRFYVPPAVMTTEQTEVAKQERDRFEARTEYTRWCTDRGVERRWFSSECPNDSGDLIVEWYEQAYPHLSTVKDMPAAAPLEPVTEADYTSVHEMLADHYAPAEIAL